MYGISFGLGYPTKRYYFKSRRRITETTFGELCEENPRMSWILKRYRIPESLKNANVVEYAKNECGINVYQYRIDGRSAEAKNTESFYWCSLLRLIGSQFLTWGEVFENAQLGL